MVTLRLGIGGIGGRMGREIVAAAGNAGVTVVGGVERAELVGETQRAVGADIRVVEGLADLVTDVDVFVDFSTAAGTIAHAQGCAEARTPFVSGVTGLAGEQMAALEALAQTHQIFYARNMSLGISALVSIVPAIVRALDGYDLEIVEMHHRHKRDAPSGTALVLAEAIAAALGTNLSETASYGREGIAPRIPGEIGIHAIRGGGNAGEHTIILANEGEEIRLAHRALNRRTFAMGAIRAAQFIVNQPFGLYTMNDLIAG